MGVSVLVISPQLEKFSKQVVKKNGLSFPVLSDRSNQVASQFGLTFRLPDDLKELYQKFNIDLERFNGDNSWQLPMPSRYIIDPSGRILDHEVNPDYTQRPEPGDIPGLLKELM
jgi:peroxiredoxin